METFLIRALQLILSLSILVVLHEFGHFFFARLFKVRVEKFYMFFNPGRSLIRAKRINGKWQVRFLAPNVPANERQRINSEGIGMVDAKGKPIMEPMPVSSLPDGDWRKYPDTTEWGIGWLPLGGYCKIAGMVDESMDKTQLMREPSAWEYRSRSVWQRLPIIIGGVLVNFILALVIYSAILFTWGKEYLPLENAQYGFQFSPAMVESGFRQGDKIISVDGQKVVDRSDFISLVLIDGLRNVVVVRDSREVELRLPANFAQRILAAEELDLISIRYPFVVEEVEPDGPAAKAALQKGDSIVGVNGKPMAVFQDITSEIEQYAGQAVTFQLYRNGNQLDKELTLDENSKLGVTLRPLFHFFETKKMEYGFFEAIPAGITLGWETLVSYIKQFKLVFTKEGSKQIGGFGSIGKMFPKAWDWQVFWSMTALLSVVLAFMNILPIPGLDGGHVMFILYEMITGRQPGDKFLEYAQTAGMFLLFALLIYANGNDIFKAFFK